MSNKSNQRSHDSGGVMTLDEILEKVEDDKTSGAAKTFDNVTEALIEQVASNELELDSSKWSSFALRLFRLRPTMAPVFHLVNEILLLTEEGVPRAAYLSSLVEMRDRERKALGLLVANAIEHLNGSKFLIISSSGSVVSVLLELAKNRRVSAIVMSSMPGGEGEHAAEFLSRQGIEVELVDDSMVFQVARECDAGLCGADSISVDGVINKVGTYSLAMACRERGIGCHVLATRSKCTPLLSEDMMVTRRSSNGVRRRKQVFELVPLSLFDACINEEGEFAMTELAARIRAITMAKSWKGILPRPGLP
jgi:translation initiation factor eIF-2B subunit delta